MEAAAGLVTVAAETHGDGRRQAPRPRGPQGPRLRGLQGPLRQDRPPDPPGHGPGTTKKTLAVAVKAVLAESASPERRTVRPAARTRSQRQQRVQTRKRRVLLQLPLRPRHLHHPRPLLLLLLPALSPRKTCWLWSPLPPAPKRTQLLPQLLTSQKLLLLLLLLPTVTQLPRKTARQTRTKEEVPVRQGRRAGPGVAAGRVVVAAEAAGQGPSPGPGPARMPARRRHRPNPSGFLSPTSHPTSTRTMSPKYSAVMAQLRMSIFRWSTNNIWAG